MPSATNAAKKVLDWATLPFVILGIIALVFLISFLMIYGLTTGFALFLFSAILIGIMQVFKVADVWKHPWLVLVPPALILVGWGGQFFSALSITPLSISGGAMEITTTVAATFVLYIIIAASTIGLAIAGIVHYKRR